MADILVIDDQDRTLELCQRAMPEHTWQGPARCWREAQDALKQARGGIDLVLLEQYVLLPPLTVGLLEPTAAEGGDICGWLQGTLWPGRFELIIEGVGGAATIDTPALFARDKAAGPGGALQQLWGEVATLNGGAQIAVSNVKRWRRTFELVAGADRLCLVGTVAGAGTVRVLAIPLETRGE